MAHNSYGLLAVRTRVDDGALVRDPATGHLGLVAGLSLSYGALAEDADLYAEGGQIWVPSFTDLEVVVAQGAVGLVQVYLIGGAWLTGGGRRRVG